MNIGIFAEMRNARMIKSIDSNWRLRATGCPLKLKGLFDFLSQVRADRKAYHD